MDKQNTCIAFKELERGHNSHEILQKWGYNIHVRASVTNLFYYILHLNFFSPYKQSERMKSEHCSVSDISL